jgi:hypothetical protein
MLLALIVSLSDAFKFQLKQIFIWPPLRLTLHLGIFVHHIHQSIFETVVRDRYQKKKQFPLIKDIGRR